MDCRLIEDTAKRATVIRTAAWLVCVLIWLFPFVAHAQTGAAPKRVLVLYWYNKDYPWNVNFDRNFQAVLQSAPGGPFEYYPEYLETDRFPGEYQSRILHDHLLQKYADRSIDVLVATSDASLNFLLKYRADLFPKAPIVFVVTRTPSAEQLAAGPGMTGLNILTDHRQTVELALRLHPETKHLFIVSGTLEHDKRLETLARAQLQGYENRVEIEYFTDLQPQELIAKTKALPGRSIILYVWQQSRNEQGRVLETQEVLASFAPSVQVPIYGMTNLYIGSGAVGGYINLAEATGSKAGGIVTQVANGVRPQDIPVENAPLVPIFDWRQLRRWEISEDRLPANSVVRFKELSLWEQYRWQIIGIISLFLVEAFLIVALLAQRARRSRAEQENRKLIHSLGERVKELTALHHTARILQDESKSVHKLLQEVVELLPPAWQYPEVTAARITFGSLEFKTANFASTRWSQKAEFEAGGSRGVIEVLYLEERPKEHIGPFLLEERNLIDSLAEMISSALNRRFTQDELRASEERFTKAFQASPVPIAILNDRHRTFMEVNESWETVFGFSREETVGRTALELNFFNVEDRDRLRALGEAQGFLRDEEVDVRTKQGETRHVTMSAERFTITGELCNICLFRDVTERKRAEEELKESQRKLALAQRIAHVGHWERDLDTNLIIWSDEIYRIFGLPRRENDSPLTEWRHMLHPEDRERVSLAIDEAQRGGRRYDVEYRLMRPDGEVRYVHSHGDVIRDEQGRPRRAFGIAQDITERKRAEQALSESQKQYETLVNTIDGIVWELEAETFRFTFVSKQAERILGYAVRQWHTEPNFWANHLHPDDRDWAVGFCVAATERRVDHQFEYRMLAADGRVVWLSDHVTVNVRDDNSVCLRGVMVDITERKRAEEAFRESERRFSDTLTNIEMIAVMADMKGDITFCNDYLLRLTGWKREEAIGRNWYEMFLPEGERAKVSEILNGVDPTGEVVVHMENEIKTRSGERRLVKWTNTTLRGLDGQVIGVAALGDDITERKAAEEQLRSSTAQLRALSARLQSAREEEGTRIAREIHDELGSALTGLKWDLERLDKTLPETGNGGKIHSVHQKILTMTRLVDTTINTVRRISSELRPGVLDNLGLVAAIDWHAQHFQERTGIICRVDSLIDQVDLNREQVTAVFRIFQEAMTNVLRHAQATKVNIIIEEDEGEFIVEIKDNGRGITETERLGIHSLGLVGMRERANSVGGKLEINGIAGKGTAVIVRLSMKGGHDILRPNPAFEKNARPASSDSTERSRD